MGTSRARPTTAGAVLAAAALGVGSTTAIGLVNSPALAETGVVAHTCTTPSGSASITLDTDTAAPASVHVGDTTAVSVAGALSDDLASSLSAQGAVGFSGILVIDVAEGNVSRPVTVAIADTELEPVETPVQFTAAGTWTAATPGDLALKQGDVTATLVLRGEDDTELPDFVMQCRTSTGPAPTIDTVSVVARSTTALSLSKATSSYGEEVVATARVATTGGTPSGSVAFSVDGVARKARVDKDGVATIKIDNARTGSHAVTATFTPTDAVHYEPSTTVAQTWTVTRAASRLSITATGKRASRPTRISVRVRGAFGTEATGKVRVRLVKTGTRKKWLKVRTLKAGRATAGFGRLRKGRYKVSVLYRGDADHLRAKRVRTIRVRRG